MRHNSGMILPMTLMIMTILISITMMMIVRTEGMVSEQVYERNKWDARLRINDAEHRLFLSMLVGEQEPGGFSLGDTYIPIDGHPLKLKNDVTVRIQDQAGLLSLRYYDHDKMSRVLSSYKIQDTKRIADEIFNWQDKFNKYKYGRGAPFRTLDEVMMVAGISHAVFNNEYGDGLRDYITLLGSSWTNYAAIPDSLLSRGIYDFTSGDLDKIKKSKRDRKWASLSAILKENSLGNEGLELTQSSRYYIYYEYNGFRGRGEYQIRTSSRFPPRRSLWYFPDYERLWVAHD